ncbi:MAG: hypothetical protein JSV57_01190 [Candidatus Bathyarchaeota archaeon]|nr:MAG: hypothetical protein JSV57_01190 [Candidatus Bathyarchaeota archaeon]
MTEKEEIVRRGYDKIAKEYQASRQVFENIEELEEFASHVSKNTKVLDVGMHAAEVLELTYRQQAGDSDARVR